MALAPKPVVITTATSNPSSFDPEPLVAVGDGVFVEPQEAPAIDDTPADAAAVAADLQSVVDALVAAGVFTEA